MDVGLLWVPEEKLNSLGRMHLEEHPVAGEEILSGLPGLEEAARWVRWHHERPNGTGYPDKLKSAWTPQEARILAVASVYASLVLDGPSARPCSRRGAKVPGQGQRRHERFAVPRTDYDLGPDVSRIETPKCYNRLVILAIETSCDDTCAAIVEPDGRRALSNVVHTQTEHARYGGVVPEVASRAHLERLDGVVEKALSDGGVSLDEVDSIAVTTRPGLIGALLVGVAAAKSLAYARKLPLFPVNHLEGHVAAAYLAAPTLEPPFVALIASGGHTALYSVIADHRMNLLGETLDDAAGEALDKGARMLGLGFPGGPEISRAASDGDPDSYDFPIGLKDKNNLDFSFSGLKTSLLYKLKAMDRKQLIEELPHLAASYEAAVVEALSRKLLRAVDLHNASAAVVAGGVAANASLRRTLEQECAKTGTELIIPPPDLCTDNAAMIGAAAPHSTPLTYPEYLSLNARSV